MYSITVIKLHYIFITTTQRFQEFIDALSHQLGDDIALIQLDQAGAHVTSALHWPDNLIPGKSTRP